MTDERPNRGQRALDQAPSRSGVSSRQTRRVDEGEIHRRNRTGGLGGGLFQPQAGGDSADFDVNYRQSDFNVGNRQSDFNVNNRQSDFNVGNRQSDFNVNNRQSDFNVNNRQSDFNVNNRQSDFDVDNRQSDFDVDNRQSDVDYHDSVVDKGVSAIPGGRHGL
jgi:hypothetical protein